MLKQRILTALILIPLFVALVIFLSAPAFAVLTALIVLWGAFEWSSLMGIKTLRRKLIYPLLIFCTLVSSLWLRVPNMLAVALVWWLLASIMVMRYPRGSELWGKSIVVRGFMGFFVLVPCWLALNFIRTADHGVFTLLFLFVLIWGADSGAYFAGRKWGKTKLAPQVSPGKSWEGLLGALITTVLITCITLEWLHLPYRAWGGALLLSLVTVIFSVLGDLFESMLKRIADLKDSGQLLPGHGGILDRVDSLTAAAPIFVLGALLLGKF